MLSLLLAVLFFAFLDSLDVLLVGVTTAVVYDSRLGRRSPVPGGLSFIAGVFAVTTAFGLCAVLGLNFLTTLIDFRVTPAVRYWGELGIGVALIMAACLPSTTRSAAPAWTVTIRRRPWVLGLAGIAIGLGKAPTAVPYLAALAMLSAHDPLPPLWPLIVIAYCALALLLPLLVLGLATRRTARAQRFYRRAVRAFTRYGPPSVRIVFIVLGVALILDTALHYQHLT
ncbi:hypothetical protein HLB23_16925 [Nocardia uniformis]|uniref:Sap-like sulfolipid-1-addressing protein n=1 Tax=Nocardia uniformis TaxID=53432 RepID=A0A849C1I6_9NOCA|nr:GAP family protein [Nocardia uniformis]NNH71528.1 hypothetical protein [Nocardia uniformis]